MFVFLSVFALLSSCHFFIILGLSLCLYCFFSPLFLEMFLCLFVDATIIIFILNFLDLEKVGGSRNSRSYTRGNHHQVLLFNQTALYSRLNTTIQSLVRSFRFFHQHGSNTPNQRKRSGHLWIRRSSQNRNIRPISRNHPRCASRLGRGNNSL